VKWVREVAVVAYFKASSYHSSSGPGEDHEGLLAKV